MKPPKPTHRPPPPTPRAPKTIRPPHPPTPHSAPAPAPGAHSARDHEGDGRRSPDAPARLPRLRRGIAIVFEDDDLLVVDKPTGIITADPASSGEGGRRSARAGNTVFDILKEYVRSQPGAARARGRVLPPTRSRTGDAGPHTRDQGVWIIHRLDKEASGLLVFAKSLRAFNWLKEDLRAKRINREYLAVVEGTLGEPGETGTIQTFIKDDGPAPKHKPRPRPARRTEGRPPGANPPHDPEHGKLAVTHYKVVAGQGGGGGPTPRTLVRIRLDTGRKNQIRIHFSERKQPLLGDRKFGAATDPLDRLALHATELAFTHPGTGRPLRFESPAPASFYRIVGIDAPPTPASDLPAKAAGATEAPPPPPPTPRPPSPPAQPRPPVPPPSAPTREGGGATSWDAVAAWYDNLLEDRGNDHYQQVIVPGTLRLLEPRPGMRILDVACGQGIFGRRLAALGVESLGVEASPRLVQAAERRARDEGVDRLCRYRVGDARELVNVEPVEYDAAICIMALANIDPLAPVMQGVAAALKPGGHFVWVITHPAFRPAGQSDWGWDAKQARQYRRIDGYLSPGQKPIEMNPGKAARGQKTETTWTFHRPLQTYVEAMAQAGLLVQRLEEWPSLRASTSGPRAAEENRARREIPLFLGVRGVKAGT